MFIAASIAMSIFLVGLIGCLIGYQSPYIMEIRHWEEGDTPKDHKDELSPTDDIIFTVLYDFRYVGPVVMGVGGFIMLCVCVVMYNEKDRIETGESKMISSDTDIYNRAIQDYLEREERSKNKYSFLDNSSHPLESSVLNQDSMSYRSASYCSMNSSVVKFGNFYLQTSEMQQTQLIEPDDAQNNLDSISRNHSNANSSAGPMIQLSIPKMKMFQMSLRHCSSDSEDIDRYLQNGNNFLIRQSTTSSSSPTLNLSEYAVPSSSDAQHLIAQQIQSTCSSYNQLVHSNHQLPVVSSSDNNRHGRASINTSGEVGRAEVVLDIPEPPSDPGLPNTTYTRLLWEWQPSWDFIWTQVIINFDIIR